MAKNPFGKTVKVDAPYAVYKGSNPLTGETEVRVLKTYQTPDKEAKNLYARWFVAVKTDMTGGGFDMGDTYIGSALRGLKLVECTDEWRSWYA